MTELSARLAIGNMIMPCDPDSESTAFFCIFHKLFVLFISKEELGKKCLLLPKEVFYCVKQKGLTKLLKYCRLLQVK